MPSWYELNQQFHALSQPLRHLNLQYQWGAAGTYYHLSGGPGSPEKARFESLCRVAGAKLQELPPEVLDPAVLAESISAHRWYEALRHLSSAFKFDLVAQQTDKDGNDQGGIYGGTIYQPADASALVALELSHHDSLPAPPPGGSIYIRQRDGVISIGQQGDLHAHRTTLPTKGKKGKFSLWQWAIGATTILAGIVGLLQWLQIGPQPQPPPAGRQAHYNDDLHVMKFAHGHIEAGKATNINLYLRYTGSDPARVHSSYGVDLLPLGPTEQADSNRVAELTESMWSSYLAQRLRGEDMTLPPNTQQFVSTWSRPLTRQQSDDWHLRKTGLLIALGRISWTDDTGTYYTDFCVLALASNPDVIVLCRNHNGPVTRAATK